MKQPLQITFRNMESSEEMEANIRDMAENLDRFYNQTMSCRVVVEAQHRHHGQGNPYHVRIDLTVERSIVDLSASIAWIWACDSTQPSDPNS